MVRRFCKCNFGELDNTSRDIDKKGGFNFERVKCPMRGECKYEGIICNPQFNSRISDAEMRVMRLGLTMMKLQIDFIFPHIR